MITKKLTFPNGDSSDLIIVSDDSDIRLRYASCDDSDIVLTDDGNGFDAYIEDVGTIRLDYVTACNFYYVLRELMLNTNLGEPNPEVWIKE